MTSLMNSAQIMFVFLSLLHDTRRIIHIHQSYAVIIEILKVFQSRETFTTIYSQFLLA